MRTTRTPTAAVLTTGLWAAVLGGACFVAAARGQAPAGPAERAEAAAAAAADAPGEGRTRTYDIHDLLWYTTDGGDAGRQGLTRKAVAEDIVRLITEVIEPEGWKAPGSGNAIEERDGRLVVTALDQVHNQLADLLRQLRETSMVQGVSLDVHFVIADEAFVERHAPAALSRREPGGVVRGISRLRARKIVEAAREVPGAVVIPAAPLPLYSLPTSVLIGEERRLTLPRLGPDGQADPAAEPVEVTRPAGLGLSVEAVADERYVTLDLMARSGSLEAIAGADGAPGGFEETEGLFHDTFVVERSDAFMIRAPLVRARLAGVRVTRDAGTGDGGDARPAGQEVVREVEAADQSDPPRHLLFVATVRPMPLGELTLLVGPQAAKMISERFVEDPPELPPPARPGVPPPPPAPPEPPEPPEPPARITRVYNLRGLLIGPERGPARGPARAKRLERVLARLKAAINDDAVRVRERHGALVVHGMPHHYERIGAALQELRAERLVEPE